MPHRACHARVFRARLPEGGGKAMGTRVTSGLRGRTGAVLLFALLFLSILLSLSLGRFPVPLKAVAGILLEPLFDIPAFW
ncbi:MAG: hypothetical protein LBI62_01365, partial [Candidatus Accumulibacter sp.]|nr:hypothetical protein [Accumulibacter sp.]